MAENDISFTNSKLGNSTLVSRLKELAMEKPSKPAFIFVDKNLVKRVITRKEIWDKSRKYAAVLKQHGIQKGDIVCNSLTNSPERLITCLGTVVAGAVSMHGIAMMADGQDLIHNLKLSKCKAIIVDPGDKKGASFVLDKMELCGDNAKGNLYEGLPDLSKVFEVRACNLDESNRWFSTLDQEMDMFVEENLTPDDHLAVLLTSGTTGFSKMVLHNHRTLVHTPNDFCPPGEGILMFNMQSFGFGGGFPFRYPRTGYTRLLIDEAPGKPEDIGEFIVDLLNLVRVDCALLFVRDIQHVLGAIRRGHRIPKPVTNVLTGAGPVHQATAMAFNTIADNMTVVYGSNECGIVSSMIVDDRSKFKEMCAGKPLHSKIKVIGEDGHELPSGSIGEIVVKSHSMFLGYLNAPTTTSQSLTADGMYRTGDFGYIDSDGLLYVLGRQRDAIICDDFVHYPSWIEGAINTMQGIKDSVVIGIPDPLRHEVICACVCPQPGVNITRDMVEAHCKTMFLTALNDNITPLPSFILFFDQLPYNLNGKVKRNTIKAQALDRIKNGFK